MGEELGTSSDSDRGQAGYTVFISHRLVDGSAADALAARLKTLSPNLEIFLAHNKEFKGPRYNAPLSMELEGALRRARLVLLLFSSYDEGWGWCAYECGVAVDVYQRTPTSIVVIQLRGGDAPPFRAESLVVRANERKDIQRFVNQICTEPSFFPGLDQALTGWESNSQPLLEVADKLFTELEPYTRDSRPQEDPWVDSLTLSLQPEQIDTLKELDPKASIDDEGPLLRSFRVTDCVGRSLSHFNYARVEPQLTLADLRQRWLEERPKHGDSRANRTPWSSIILRQAREVATNRNPKLTWEPFLSLRDNTLWVYPLIYRSRLHPTGGLEFDILIIPTLTPEELKEGT